MAPDAEASVNDTFHNSDSGPVDSLNHDGPLRRTPPSFGTAILLVNPRACTHVLNLAFQSQAVFRGTTTNPGPAGGGTAYSPRSPVSRNLRLNGTAALPVRESCSAKRSLLGDVPCFAPAGGWTPDYLMLKRCRSTVAGNCDAPNRALGVATFAWHLKPT